MNVDLILKDIDDKYVRENFTRLKKILQNQPVLNGEWKFYEIDFNQAYNNFLYPHGLTFIPKDVLLTSITNQGTVLFNFDEFDDTNLNITVTDACTVRFFAGKYEES